VYETNILANEKGHKVLRLPVRHCELNPIEYIQGEMKGFVARYNKTFKLSDVKVLFEQAKETITQEKWAKHVNHVITDAEAHFTRVDCLYKEEPEPLVISGDDFDSSDEFDGASSSDEEDEEEPCADSSTTEESALSKALSATLDLSVADLHDPSASTMPGPSSESMVEEDHGDLCGKCGSVDPIHPASGTKRRRRKPKVTWVNCDLCCAWYHCECEPAPPGGYEDKYICKTCTSTLNTSNFCYLPPRKGKKK
jgi:hypothetical protein